MSGLLDYIFFFIMSSRTRQFQIHIILLTVLYKLGKSASNVHGFSQTIAPLFRWTWQEKKKQPWVGTEGSLSSFPDSPPLLAMLPSLQLQKHVQHRKHLCPVQIFASQKNKAAGTLKEAASHMLQRVHPLFATVLFLWGQFSLTDCKRWMLTLKVTCIGNVSNV